MDISNLSSIFLLNAERETVVVTQSNVFINLVVFTWISTPIPDAIVPKTVNAYPHIRKRSLLEIKHEKSLPKLECVHASLVFPPNIQRWFDQDLGGVLIIDCVNVHETHWHDLGRLV